MDPNWLPNPVLLQSVVRWIFNLLQQDGAIHVTHLIVACKLFDSTIQMSSIRQSLVNIDLPEGAEHITERTFYHWIVFMFALCTEEEFLSGCNEFGEAAKKVKGNLDPRSMFAKAKVAPRRAPPP